MGSQWSQTSSQSKSSSSNSRKRKRNAEDEDEDEDDNNNGQTQTQKTKEPSEHRQRKRRRTTPSFGMIDTLHLWLTKFSLLMIESVDQFGSRYHVDRPHLEKATTFLWLTRMLQYFQLRDIDILRRGWKAIYLITTDANDRLDQRPVMKSRFEKDVALITTVMKSHSNCEEIQFLGLRAMEYLVTTSYDKNKYIVVDWATSVKGLVKGGAISAFIDILRNFQNCENMTTCCVMFLFILIKEGEDVNSRRMFIELGGIPLLLQAIRHCVDNADLLRTGCALIHHLSTFGSSRSDLFNHHVIDVLIIVMNNYQNNPEILKMCIVSLRQISTDNDLTGQGRHIFIPLLIRLMNLHPNDDGVQFYSLILMGTVGRTEPIHHRLTVPTIVSAMRRFPDHGRIGFFGSLLFWKILSNDSTTNNEALLFISSSGGIECVIAATIANNDNIDGLATVAHAILTHAWENRPSEQEAAVVAFGGNRRIISLITKYNVRNAINANDDDDDVDEGVIHIVV